MDSPNGYRPEAALRLDEIRAEILQPNGIQAILFDLDGTLRHNRPASATVFLDHAASLGAADSPELRRQAIRWTHSYWAQSPELAQDLKDYPEVEQFWSHYAYRFLLAFACSPEQAADLAPQVHSYMRSMHQPEDIVLPDVPETLQNLKAWGFHLGVLSNRDEPCNDYLGQIGLAQYFELALVAGELSAWKPQPEIFLLALQRLGLKPHETLYVGDNYYADIIGAERAGLHPVLIDPDGLFPEARCQVIRSIGELPEAVRAIHGLAQRP